jgi:hypothetical protein
MVHEINNYPANKLILYLQSNFMNYLLLHLFFYKKVEYILFIAR